MNFNLDVLDFSRKHPEPYVDNAYEKEYFIITKDNNSTNRLIEANNQIIKCITAFEINNTTNNSSANKKIVDRIVELLDTPNINNSEFTSYWEVNDISFSMYRHFNRQEKIVFLNNLLPKYIEKRHLAYTSHGYTPTTLQVKADSFAHKRSGELGLKKVKYLFQKFKFNLHTGSADDFLVNNNIYLFSDKRGKKVFDNIKKKIKINFEWQKNHKGKRPDFIFRINNQIFILEHKHMKEGGGGQDKQIVEVSSFINYTEHNVSYVAFLDGIYFNKLFLQNNQGVVAEQQKQIIEALQKNPNNYFLNTKGFCYFLKNIEKVKLK